MPLRLEALPPAAKVIDADNIEALIDQQLGQAGFVGGVIREMSDYPGQQATISNYRRTGTYGRGWVFGARRRRGNVVSASAVNRVLYAIRVGGPRRGAKGRRQTKEMKRRGWPNITDVGNRQWKRFGPRIVQILEQRDPRQRRSRARTR